MIALRWHVLRLPLLLSLLWCLLLFALFQWTVQREGENATELAQICLLYTSFRIQNAKKLFYNVFEISETVSLRIRL